MLFPWTVTRGPVSDAADRQFGAGTDSHGPGRPWLS